MKLIVTLGTKVTIGAIVTAIFIALLLPTVALAAKTSTETVLVLGDSLSAGYGIDPSKGWVTLLNNRLSDQYAAITIVNKSVSGSTTQNGLERLPELITQFHPTLVILALGSNDGLRGMSLFQMRKNLEKMINFSEAAGAKVLLIGFLIPSNYGPPYSDQFAKIFPALSEKYDLPFVPFLLEGVAQNPQYVQADNLHPNEAAQPIILENVWPVFKKMVGIK